MKKIIVLGLLSILFAISIGCEKESDTKPVSQEPEKVVKLISREPQKVVEDYFKYMNEKDEEKASATLTPRYNKPNSTFGFENLKEIKLTKIREDETLNMKERYVKYGRGKEANVKVEDVNVYETTYEVAYKEDIGPEESGVNGKYFWVVRQESGEWLIDGMGE